MFWLGSTDVTITVILVAFLREKSRNFVGTCVGHAGLFDERKSVKFLNLDARCLYLEYFNQHCTGFVILRNVGQVLNISPQISVILDII